MSTSSKAETSCACFVCNETRKQRLCSQCAQTTVVSQQSLPEWKRASERHKAIQQQVEVLLQAQEEDSKQQSRLNQARDRLLQAQRLQKSLQERRDKATDEARRLRQEIAKRRSALHEQDAQKKLAETKLANGQMLRLEGQASLNQLLAGPLAAEIRRRIGALMDVVPLSTSQSGQQRGGHESKHFKAHRTVYVLGCQLPAESAGPPAARQQERCTSALGYMVFILDVLASVLDVPQLSQLHFQCATSSLGQRQSFWDNGSIKVHKLHPFHMDPPPNKATRSDDNWQGSTINSWKHRLQWEGKFRTNAPISMAREVTDHRQDVKYRLAVHHLCREIGMLGSGHPAFVLQDSLFAALSDFCWQIAMRPRSDNAGAASIMEASSFMRQPESSLHSMLAERVFEEDGWDLIQRPFQSSTAELVESEMAVNMMMPPAPSEGEDVIKHWEKANFPTPTRYLTTYLRPQSISRHVAPLRQTALAAADNLLHRFGLS